MRIRSAALVVVTFAVLILIGTGLLQLLILPVDDARSPIVTPAFTAVSAVCVTGLTVVDLSRDTGFAGQLAVLVLIQIGGLGVLTLSNWVLLSLRGRLGVYESVIAHETVGAHARISPSMLIRRILAFTVSFEVAGAAVLFVRFLEDFRPGQAAWMAVFHSVSAFCNAGFSLFSDSLTRYGDDVVVNLTVIGLIVAGGLGFVAAMDVIEFLGAAVRGVRRPLAFHTQTVVGASVVLIAIGTVVFLAFEWNNTFASETFGGELGRSLFLSVTTRTAGFNTVETAHLTNMTLVVVILLMVIGASPGSTGGGVKTSVLVVLWASVRAQLINRPDTELGRRRIADELVAKALALVVLYTCLVIVGLIALQATEFGELPHQVTRDMFLEHLFEVVSALSTVGLTMGLTTRLTDGGLVVLMGLMFVGRVGPLVIAASLIGERPRLDYRLPEADIMIG